MEKISTQKIKKQGAVSLAAKTVLPSRYGMFTIYAFVHTDDNREHLAIVKGNISDKENVPLRIHSECLTGDVLGSLRCDCGPQLDKALAEIGKCEYGLVLYLRQEGRGIGLVNKLKAYALQDKGMDTYEANVELGFKPDERTYDVATDILRFLRVKSVSLLTNNPKKIECLARGGIAVRRVPHITGTSVFNARYLLTKKKKFGHLLDEGKA